MHIYRQQLMHSQLQKSNMPSLSKSIQYFAAFANLNHPLDFIFSYKCPLIFCVRFRHFLTELEKHKAKSKRRWLKLKKAHLSNKSSFFLQIAMPYQPPPPQICFFLPQILHCGFKKKCCEYSCTNCEIFSTCSDKTFSSLCGRAEKPTFWELHCTYL